MCTHRIHSLNSVCGPCSIEKVYPCEWRIAIPTSLMRVDLAGTCWDLSQFFRPSESKLEPQLNFLHFRHEAYLMNLKLKLTNFQQNPSYLHSSSMFLTCFILGGALNCEKEAVIKSAASAASTQRGCASSRLDHSFQIPSKNLSQATPFWILQYKNNISSRIANRYTHIFDAG